MDCTGILTPSLSSILSPTLIFVFSTCEVNSDQKALIRNLTLRHLNVLEGKSTSSKNAEVKLNRHCAK